MNYNKNEIFESLKRTVDSYYPIKDVSFKEFEKICTIRTIKKNDFAFDLYDKVDYISFIYKGLFRTFTINENGDEHNKNFFWEERFFGPIVSLLKNTPVTSSVQALEDSIIVDINYEKYRQLFYKYEDLKLFHILYLEKHWVIEKDSISTCLVLYDAKNRYKYFLDTYPKIIKRLPLYHIASFLGITPTHLSRIRKELKT